MANPGVDVKYIGDEPTFQNFTMLDELGQRIAISKAFNWYSYFYGTQDGLTKREYFASLAMQGLLTRVPKRFDGETDLGILESKIIAEESVIMANELIKALNEGGQDNE